MMLPRKALVLSGAMAACVMTHTTASADTVMTVVTAQSDSGKLGSGADRGPFVFGGGSRLDLNNVLDSSPTTFTSVGMGGYITFAFDPSVTGDTTVIEVTGGSRVGYKEKAHVYVSNDDSFVNWTHVADIDNQAPTGISNLTLAGGWKYLKIEDFSLTTDIADASQRSIADGFDIGQLTVTAVPLPAAVWGGMAMFGVLGGLKLRRARDVR